MNNFVVDFYIQFCSLWTTCSLWTALYSMNSCLVHEQFLSLWTATSHFSVQYTFRRRSLRTHQSDCTIYLGTSLYNLEFRVSSVRQGSTKWLYWLFKIMINIISHFIFFLKITAKSQNKYVFLTETYLCGKF